MAYKDIKNNKVIESMYVSLRGPVNKPKLKNLTFEDVKTICKQLAKFKNLSKKKKDKEWERKACTICSPKLGH